MTRTTKEQRAKAKSLATELREYQFWSQTNQGTDAFEHPVILDDASATILALLNEIEGAEKGEAVKPLEWRECTSQREDGPPEPIGEWEAPTLIGEYSVTFDPDEDVKDYPWCAFGPESIGHFADPDEAKSEAQADYETRIRSALYAVPVPAKVTEEMEAVIAEREACARIAERDTDWTLFQRRKRPDPLTGEETNIFAEPPDEDLLPTQANVMAYRLGIAAGRAIAAAIRARALAPQEPK